MMEKLLYSVLGFFGIYVLFRIASLAIAKSWFQVKQSHQIKEVANGEEEKEKERKQ